MIKFRSSSHTLEIEKGRHSNPRIPIEMRLCKNCGVIEDEMHFLLHCTRYLENRSVLIRKVSEKYAFFTNYSDECKFVFLLSYNDQEILTRTAKFIYNSFEHDRQSLFN